MDLRASGDRSLWDAPVRGHDVRVVAVDAEALVDELDRLKQALGLEPGARTVGRFRLVSQLGKGGMGVVHAAFDPELDRMVALKLVRPRQSGARERLQARLQREARALGRLAHPNVVRVYDVGSDGDELFIAMELVDGPTLLEWQSQRERSLDELLDVYVQAAIGLAAAHDAGLVHRDFKPENVFVTADERVLVGDFGLANLEDAVATTTDDADEQLPGLTETGALLGTPGYMAPEQLRGDAVDPRADQFAFCVALWEAITGERPFASGTKEAMLAAIEAGELRLASQVPRQLRAILRRGLAYDHHARFADLRELVAAIESLRGRRPWLRVGVGVLALAAALAAVLTLRESAEPCEERARIDRVWTQGRAGLAEQLSRASASVLEQRAEAAIEHLRRRADAVCRAPSDARRRVLGRAIDELAAALAKPESVQLEGWAALIEQLESLDLDRPAIEPAVAEAIDRSRLHEWYGETERAWQAADQAVALAQAAAPSGWSASLSEALTQRGRMLEDRSEYERAIEDFTRAEAHAEGSGYGAQMFRARLEAAAVLVKFVRDRNRAHAALLRLEPLLQRHSAPLSPPRALRHELWSAFSMERGELGRCVAHSLAAALVHAVVHPDPAALARAYENLAVALERHGVRDVEPLYQQSDQLLRAQRPERHRSQHTLDYNRARRELESEDEHRRAEGRATLQRLHGEGDRSTRSLAARALLYDAMMRDNLAVVREMVDELRPELPEDPHVLMASARLGELDGAALQRLRQRHLEREDMLYVVMLDLDIAGALAAAACDVAERGREHVEQIATDTEREQMHEGVERLLSSLDCR